MARKNNKSQRDDRAAFLQQADLPEQKFGSRVEYTAEDARKKSHKGFQNLWKHDADPII